MASPESPSYTPSPLTERDHRAALAYIDRLLEAVDENENLIERFFQREKLLDVKDELETEIDEIFADDDKTA